jgi:hypothetical protein
MRTTSAYKPLHRNREGFHSDPPARNRSRRTRIPMTARHMTTGSKGDIVTIHGSSQFRIWGIRVDNTAAPIDGLLFLRSLDTRNNHRGLLQNRLLAPAGRLLDPGRRLSLRLCPLLSLYLVPGPLVLFRLLSALLFTSSGFFFF